MRCWKGLPGPTVAAETGSIPYPVSEEDRREPGAGGLVEEAGGHEGHGFDDAEAVREAPAEKISVAGGTKRARPGDESAV